jgi:hypothetical protein
MIDASGAVDKSDNKSDNKLYIDIYNFKIDNYPANDSISKNKKYGTPRKFTEFNQTIDKDNKDMGIIRAQSLDDSVNPTYDDKYLSSIDYIYSSKYLLSYTNNNAKNTTELPIQRTVSFTEYSKLVVETIKVLRKIYNNTDDYDIPDMFSLYVESSCDEDTEDTIKKKNTVNELRKKIKTIDKTGFIHKLTVSDDDKVIVFGDYHGSYHTFFRNITRLHIMGVLDFTEHRVNKNYYVIFLGDIVDRGSYSIEILYILFKFINNSEGRMILIRGNHEEIATNTRYGFENSMHTGVLYEPNTIPRDTNYEVSDDAKCEASDGAKCEESDDTNYEEPDDLHMVYIKTNIAFSNCPSAIILNTPKSKLWLSHGFIVNTPDDKMIEFINSPDSIRYQCILNEGSEIRWNDPPLYNTSIHGRGSCVWSVGREILEAFQKKTGISYIIRGHLDNFSNSWILRNPEKVNDSKYKDSYKYKELMYDLIKNNGDEKYTSISRPSENRIPGPIRTIDVSKFNEDTDLLPVLTISTNTDKERSLVHDSFCVIRFNNNKLPDINNNTTNFDKLANFFKPNTSNKYLKYKTKYINLKNKLISYKLL